MDLISPIAMLMMGQAAPTDALSASSPWRVDAIERGCELSQRYGGASPGLFTIRREPGDSTSAVRLDVAGVPNNARSATLRNEDSGEEVSADALSGYTQRPTQKYLQIGRVDNAFLTKLGPEAAVSFSVQGRPVAKLAIANLDSALPALEQCETMLLREWGIDPASMAGLKTRPEPANEPRAWVTSDDYPPGALKVTNQRDAILRFKVTRDGRVADCAIAESSGSPVLDKAACSLVTRRARYRPAVASDGSVREAWAVQTVRWTRM